MKPTRYMMPDASVTSTKGGELDCAAADAPTSKPAETVNTPKARPLARNIGDRARRMQARATVRSPPLQTRTQRSADAPPSTRTIRIFNPCVIADLHAADFQLVPLQSNSKHWKTLLTRRFATIAAALALSGPPITADAQQPGSEPVIVDIGPCVELETPERQRECYEDRINEVVQGRAANGNNVETKAGSAATAEPEPPRATRRARRREARAAERRRKAAAEAAATAAEAAEAAAQAAAAADDPSYTAGEIVAKITALREIEPDAYLITLDNGQIWRQHYEKSYLLRVGSEVRLRPSNWGPSYRLTDPSVGNFIVVRRVR